MPTAYVGLKPKRMTRIGVISEPPPMPVSPTIEPISRPVSVNCQVIATAQSIIPAPTVSFVASSMRMNAPVSRFSAYGSTASGSERRSRTTPMSFSSSRSGRGDLLERLDVGERDELVDDRAHRARRVLDADLRARLERPLAHPADARLDLARDDRRRAPGRRACCRGRRRRRRRAGSSPTAAARRPRAARRRSRPPRRASAGPTAARRPRRPPARRRPRPCPRSRGSRGARRTSAGSPTAPGSGGASRFRSNAISIVSRCSSSGGPSYHGMCSERVDDVVAAAAPTSGSRAGRREAEQSRGRGRSRRSAPATSRRDPSCSRRP